MKTGALRILLAEDVQADAELCIEILAKAGFSVNADVCGTAYEFERLLAAGEYDIVLADYNLVEWAGAETIEIVQRLGKNTPVIVVTGLLGDEKAVDCIHQGAADYVLKDRLSRLPFAVRRAIDDNILRTESRLLAAAVRSTGEGILIAEAATAFSDARIVTLNEAFARITGYTPEELIGKPFGVFKPIGDGPGLFADHKAISTNLGLFVAETLLKRKDGSIYDAEWQISPISGPLGRITHYVVIHRDITQRKRTAAELGDAKSRAEAATRAKSEFLASMSHEIRTPMNAIIGMADLLSDTSLTADQSKYVEVFQRAGENLLVLINQLLDLAKIESGKFDLEQIDFDLNTVLGKTIALFESPAQSKGVSLSFHLDPDTPTRLIGDPHQLEHVVMNLVGNAMKFTSTGSIRVEANLSQILADSACLLEFKVTDTGVGIQRDKISLIFDNFTQADSSITRQYGGTGLGLAISRALVERMKGEIAVVSEVGVGSTFSFTASFGLQCRSPKLQHGPALCRVLLCEDSQDNAFLVKAYLSGNNYLLEHVTDGEAGFKSFDGGMFDIVLMDLQMPVLDGHAATQKIRQWEADHNRKPIPIFALTAHAQAEEQKRCESSGFTGFLTKPLRKATLLAALTKCLPGTSPYWDQSDLALEVLELVPHYLEQRRLDLYKLSAAIQADDYSTVSTLGHQLKGSGASYGFQEFSRIGMGLENAAKTHDPQETCRLVELLSGAVTEALAVGPNNQVVNGK